MPLSVIALFILCGAFACYAPHYNPEPRTLNPEPSPSKSTDESRVLFLILGVEGTAEYLEELIQKKYGSGEE